MSPILESIGSVKGFGWGSFSLSPSFESIQTFNITDSTPSVTFSSIPQTYKHLQLRCSIRHTGNNDGKLTINGVTETTSYTTHYLRGNNGVNVQVGTGAGFAYFGSEVIFALNTANINSATIIDFADYSSTSKNKTVRGFHGRDYNNTSGVVQLWSGLFSSTDAITSLTYEGNSVSIASGSTISLYGIKG